MNITTSKEIDGKKMVVTVDYPIGEDLNEAIQKYSEELVYSYYRAHAVVYIQNVVRRLMVAGKNEKEIQEEISKTVLGVARPKIVGDPVVAFTNRFQKLPDNEKKKILKKLQAAAK